MLIGIGLLVAALFVIIGGGSPFVIPHLDNHVKTHVVDNAEKKIVLDLLDEEEGNRKEVSKKNADYVKELHKLSVSREATQENFDKLGEEMFAFNTEAQKVNLQVTQKAQQHITASEWEAIHKDIAADLEKSDKKKAKHVKELESAFDKWIDKINQTIEDPAKRKAAVKSVENLRSINVANFKQIEAELLNQSSPMYKYQASESELKTLQNDFINLVKEVYHANTKTHFDLVKNTTADEWKKIQ